MPQEITLDLDKVKSRESGKDWLTGIVGDFRSEFKKKFGREPGVTGGPDTPMHRKLHGMSGAFDLRSKDMTPDERRWSVEYFSGRGVRASDYTDPASNPNRVKQPHIHVQGEDQHNAPHAGEVTLDLDRVQAVGRITKGSALALVPTKTSGGDTRPAAMSNLEQYYKREFDKATGVRTGDIFQEGAPQADKAKAEFYARKLGELGWEAAAGTEGWWYVKPPAGRTEPATQGMIAQQGREEAARERKQQQEEFRRTDKREAVRRFAEGASRGRERR